jgi:chromosomal replication initiation ATPase DnaA
MTTGIDNNPEHIVELVELYWGVPHHALVTGVRRRRVSRARATGCWLLREYTDLSLTEIGEYVGAQHHSSVIYRLQQLKLDDARNDIVWTAIDALSGQVEALDGR